MVLGIPASNYKTSLTIELNLKSLYRGHFTMLVGHLGPECNISFTIGWIVMTFGTDTCGPDDFVWGSSDF